MPPSACSSADRQLTSASRMPSQCVDQLGRVRGGGDVSCPRDVVDGGRVGLGILAFQSAGSHLHLGLGVVCLLVWCLRGVGG